MDVFGCTLTGKQTKMIEESIRIFDNKLKTLSILLDRNTDIIQNLEHKMGTSEDNLKELQIRNVVVENQLITLENNFKNFQTRNKALENQNTIYDNNFKEIQTGNEALKNKLSISENKIILLENADQIIFKNLHDMISNQKLRN